MTGALVERRMDDVQPDAGLGRRLEEAGQAALRRVDLRRAGEMRQLPVPEVDQMTGG